MKGDDMSSDGREAGGSSDTDGDGISNHRDNDIDGDGASNAGDSDMDGDGIPNPREGELELPTKTVGIVERSVVRLEDNECELAARPGAIPPRPDDRDSTVRE